MVSLLFSGRAQVGQSYYDKQNPASVSAINKALAANQNRIFSNLPDDVQIEVNAHGEREAWLRPGNLQTYAKIQIGQHQFDHRDRDTHQLPTETHEAYIKRIVDLTETVSDLLSQEKQLANHVPIRILPSFTERYSLQAAAELAEAIQNNQHLLAFVKNYTMTFHTSHDGSNAWDTGSFRTYASIRIGSRVFNDDRTQLEPAESLSDFAARMIQFTKDLADEMQRPVPTD